MKGIRKFLTGGLSLGLMLVLFACDTGATTHYDTLQDEGKTITVSDVSYDSEENETREYEDDARSLIGTGDLSDDDVIDIPSPTFESAIREYLDLEGDITFGDVRNVQSLMLNTSGPSGIETDITSIAGIEYFESLELLDLRYHADLASINGVQALDALDTLYITKTAVKVIDYDFPSLRELLAIETAIDLDSDAFADLVNDAPNLESLRLENTPTMVGEALVDAVNTWNEGYERSARVFIDYKQVDLTSAGYQDFWTFEDGQVAWTNPAFNVKVVLSDDSEPSSIDTLYVDITDETHQETLVETLESWRDDTGVNSVKTPLGKTVLVYDYFLETITLDEAGSHSVTDALQGEPVTLDTAYQALAMVNNHLGIPSYVKPYFQQHFPSEETEAQRIMNVFYEDRKYGIVFGETLSYEYFMVGRANVRILLEESFGWEDVDMRGEAGAEYASSDLPRATAVEAAHDLNIDLKYE